MNKIYIHKRIVASLLAMLAIVGCVKDDLTGVDYRSQEYISFTAAITADTRSTQDRTLSSYLTADEQEWSLYETSDAEQTRGAIITSLSGNAVGMFAHPYKYQTNDKVFQTSVMDNKEFRFADNEKLESAGEYVLWSDVSSADSLRVYGYAPYNDNISATTTDGKTTISYTVDSDITKHQDIIATNIKEVPKDYRQNIPLTFKHILTGVRFKVGFSCTINSLKIEGVYSSGEYTIGDAWQGQEQSDKLTYTLPIPDGGLSYTEGNYVSDEILMMIPQQLPDGAKVVMKYDGDKTLTAPIAGLMWNSGSLVTYTLHESNQQTRTFYFDLAAGDVEITPTYCSGSYFYLKNGVATPRAIKFEAGKNYELDNYHVYICQSTVANRAQYYGYADMNDWKDETKIYKIPVYEDVKVGNKSWSEFITNNTDVESVIEAWDTKANIDADANSSPAPDTGVAVRQAGRTSTPYPITVKGDGKNKLNLEITLDNIYSRTQSRSNGREIGGLVFTPDVDYSTLTVNLVGDNRVGCVHYFSGKYEHNELIFQGSGSLTAACVDFYKATMNESSSSEYDGDNVFGYASNHWCSAIGGNDSSQGHAKGIKIKSGTIYAGTTQTENCTAIGGGGNDSADITIEGGVVTAVATTTGTAIGGGIGFTSLGGTANVKITGGTVYAYNHANEWEIPSAAIGSAGSWLREGGNGTVTISGGYVYAQAALGTAIGGGSSKLRYGGSATVNISGNSYVIAKSISSKDKKTGKIYPAGNGIGGGTGGEGTVSDTNDTPSYGGSATVTISGNPTIRTGSIGGGKTNHPDGKIGSATIDISGGDISAQFVMAGGAGKNSKFTMSGGTISNSDVHIAEYYHVQTYGGAVYMEDGEFKMRGGTIRNCLADLGGAVYIKKSEDALDIPKFEMSGGAITRCQSTSHGGAIYLEGGVVEISNGNITQCLAKNGNGGGLYIAMGNLSMSGNARVSENSALNKNMESSHENGNGGGIYVTSPSGSVSVTVESGSILNNSCDQNGGGVCVDMSTSTGTANIQIGKDDTSGPQINDNKAVLHGGGLYAIGSKADITINGGSIMNNSVSNYVPNADVTNEGGTVKLINGEVSHKVVTFDVNTNDSSATVSPAIQKIVTATNSFLVAPTPTRTMYEFVEWNSRPDGEGTTYRTGDIMRLESDITLYAQWRSQ